jgi:hypothetical protein
MLKTKERITTKLGDGISRGEENILNQMTILIKERMI